MCPHHLEVQPHPMSIHIAAKGLCRSQPQTKKFWGKNSQGCWRLLKAPKASWGPRKVPGAQKGQGRLREWGGVRGSKKEWEGVRGSKGEQGKQGPWVWLKTQGCWRLTKAPKASWGPRKVPGTQEGQGRLRGWGGVRGSKKEWEGARGSEGEQGKQGPWVWLKTQAYQRLPKASWGLRKVPGAQGGPERLRGQGGVRGSKGSKAPESDWRPKAAKGF